MDGQRPHILCPFRYFFYDFVWRGSTRWKLVLEVGVEVVEAAMELVLEVVIALFISVVVKAGHGQLTFSSLGPLYTAPMIGGAFSAPH